jgi:hypothetical protein
MRAIRAVTVLAVLMFIGNALLFHSIASRGYGHTIEALKPAFGAADSLVLALLSVASLVSIPVTACVGVISLIAARRLGRPALLSGLLCCVLSAGSFLLWKKYGGVSENHPATNGPTPAKSHASPSNPQRR